MTVQWSLSSIVAQILQIVQIGVISLAKSMGLSGFASCVCQNPKDMPDKKGKQKYKFMQQEANVLPMPY